MLQDVEEVFGAADYGKRSRWARALAAPASRVRRLTPDEQAARLPWMPRTTSTGRPLLALCRHVTQLYVRGDSVVLVQRLQGASPAHVATL